jgi:hypothetical protein
MKATRVSALKKSYETMDHKYTPKHPKFVDVKTYKRILKSFFKKLAYYLITTGKEIVLPSKLGALQIIKYKVNPEKKIINYPKTREYFGEWNKNNPDKQKFVYCNARLTGNYASKVLWLKYRQANFKNKTLYYFKLTRPNIRINTYNKNNPSVCLTQFFREKGWIIYQEHNSYVNRILTEKKLELKKQNKLNNNG